MLREWRGFARAYRRISLRSLNKRALRQNYRASPRYCRDRHGGRGCSSSPVSRILFRKRLRASGGDHLSATCVTARLRILRSVLPTCASASRVIRAVWHCSRWGLPGRRIAAPPVRSCRTISPLPLWKSRDSGLPQRRYVFCCTFRRPAARRTPAAWLLASTVALWSPDFPHAPYTVGRARPPGELEHADYHLPSAANISLTRVNLQRGRPAAAPLASSRLSNFFQSL
jgi:hypothetical protein